MVTEVYKDSPEYEYILASVYIFLKKINAVPLKNDKNMV